MKDLDTDEGIRVVIKVVFICIFIVAAIVGNGSVLYVIRKFPKLQTAPNYFVFNLAAADLLFALTGMVMILITSVSGDWILGDTMCDVGGLLNSIFCSTSIWTLVFISLHRYFAVTKPMRAKTMYTKKRTKVMIIGIWMFAFIISSPPLFGWSRFAKGTNFCTVDGRDDMAYSIFLLLTDYFFPFLFLTGIYLRIFFVLKKHETAMARHQNTSHSELEAESEIGITDVKVDIETVDTKRYVERVFNNLSEEKEQDENKFETIITEPVNISKIALVTPRLSSKKKNELTVHSSSTSPKKPVKRTKSVSRRKKFFKEVKVTKMLLIVVCGFFLCWTPFLVAAVLYAFIVVPPQFKLLTIGIMFACLNSIINPIIYAVMNQNFRSSFKTIAKSLLNFFVDARRRF